MISAKNTRKPKTTKTPKLSPFFTDLERESKGKVPRRIHAYIPQQIPKKTASKSLQENCQEKAPKITKKENREEHNQALRNHAESSIHTMKDSYKV
jgi:hypothetical protein